MRDFRFQVPVEWLGSPGDDGYATPSAWLDHNVAVTSDPDEAVRLRFKLHPNGIEDAAIQRRIDDITGGIGNTVDLERGIDTTRAAIMRGLGERLFPADEDVGEDGEPVELTPAEQMERRDALNQAFAGLHLLDPSDDATAELQRQSSALRRMLDLQERVEVAAVWTVLGVDHPKAWKDLADMELSTAHRNAVIRAFGLARREAETTSGK